LVTFIEQYNNESYGEKRCHDNEHPEPDETTMKTSLYTRYPSLHRGDTLRLQTIHPCITLMVLKYKISFGECGNTWRAQWLEGLALTDSEFQVLVVLNANCGNKFIT